MSKKPLPIDKTRAKLGAFVGRDSVIRVERKHIDATHLDGFVVGVSDDLLMLHLVDGSTLELNGYAVLRLADITTWRVDESFISRALRLLGRTPLAPDGIDITDLQRAIGSAQGKYPLLTIYEKGDLSSCYIGRLVKQSPRRLTLKEVDAKGRWRDCETKFGFSDIAQLEFGDGYTNGLATLVEHEAVHPRPQLQAPEMAPQGS